MSSFPYQYDPKTPFLVDQTITASRKASAYQEGLIRATRAGQYSLSKNNNAVMVSQTILNQAWRKLSLQVANIVASINELLR